MNKDEYYNGPCTRVFCPALAVNTGRLGGTGVQHDTRVDGPCRPAVNTGSVDRRPQTRPVNTRAQNDTHVGRQCSQPVNTGTRVVSTEPSRVALVDINSTAGSESMDHFK